MEDLKKTFTAGLTVLLILLLAPYYLQWIGYTEEIVNEDPDGILELNVELGIAQDELITTGHPLLEVDRTIQASQLIADGPAEEVEFIITTPLYVATISNKSGGSLNKYTLNNYLGGWNNLAYNDSVNVELLESNHGGCAPCIVNTLSDTVLNMPFECVLKNAGNGVVGNTLYLQGDGEAVLECSYLGGYKKQTFFRGDSFVIEHFIEQEGGDSSLALPLAPISLIWDVGINNTEKNLYDDISYSGASVSFNKEIESVSFIPGNIADKLETSSYSGSVDWAAIRTKYFILAMIPVDHKIANVNINGESKYLASNNIVPKYSMKLDASPSGATIQTLHVKGYFGPLDIDQINSLETTLDRIMNFGWFVIQPFSRGILWLLKFLHSFGLNYGIILILFAFLVRIITGPLTKKSFQSTQKMQAIQPELKKLQEKYKNDSQKLNTEMVKLYREHGVNPMGGCLPMLLQMPLLFSLFLVFRSTIEFRGAPFVWWIRDLSLPDTIFYLPFNVPIYGDQVAFLPILLGVSMFLTQKMSMANLDSGGMGQQKYMMYFMSAFFFLLFNSFPSGLNLYYLIYNILNYLQQKSLKKA